MRAMLFEAFGARPAIVTLPDPAPEPHGVVVEVGATGLCRSDWHGWMGHDPDIVPPHVPGHELAGTVVAVGREVQRWRVGDRVTMPFVAGCGACGECRSGNQQVCPGQFQPGFTHWGSFAERVSLHYADTNLVALPDGIDFAAAASLGCRFATSFRAVIDQGRVKAGEWIAVHGCGGVGLSAVMIAAALDARVIAIDIDPAALALARSFGAVATLDARHVDDIPDAIATLSGGGAHVSIDALGSAKTLANALLGLRRRGRHVQVGLLAGADKDPPVPMGRVIGWELEIVGSHGMQAHRYDAMFAMIEAGRLHPDRLVSRHISLDRAVDALVGMGGASPPGATVITAFG